MKQLFTLLFFAGLGGSLIACGDAGQTTATSSGASSGGDCKVCTSKEICASYLGGATKSSECAPIPAACGAKASCNDTMCVGALYNLCKTGWTGVGCSDTFAPTILSCNPSK